MPNYKCECPMVFSGDDAQRDREIHMDSCEFRKIRIERDALLLQIHELEDFKGKWIVGQKAYFDTVDELEAANRLNALYKSTLDWICGYAHIRGLKDIEARCEEVSPSEKRKHEEDDRADYERNVRLDG